MTKEAEEEFWLEEKERYENLDSSKKKRAKLVVQIVNATMVVIGLSFIFYPVAYRMQLLALLIIPWLLLLIVNNHSEYFKAFSFRESAFPGFGMAFLSAYWSVVIRSIIDYTILNYSTVWLLTLICAPLLTVLFLYLAGHEIGYGREKKISKVIVFVCLLTAFSVYTFFAVIMINCSFDFTPILYKESEVLDKYSSHSRKSGTTYYALVELPEKYGKQTSVRMSEKRWNKLIKGQQIDLAIQKGLLGVDWLEIDALTNNVMLKFIVVDSIDSSPLKKSRAIVKCSTSIDTIQSELDSISFLLSFDKKYVVEFKSDGYETKTIIFNTFNIPEEEKEHGFLVEGALIRLKADSVKNINDTVAEFYYNKAIKNFELKRHYEKN